ncbi:MAG TPA: hypothetical protein VG939_04440 [Caulobacteraceae bacterium]|nr:hypothetical protein [Caulobacteraceae bacterium]
MTGLLRLLLLLVLAGAALTALVSLAMWLMNEERRLRRAITRVLGAAPDALLVAHGRGRAAGISVGAGGLAVAWDTGGWCLVYPLEALIGVELVVDGHVVARAFRDEPRRPLERLPKDAETVALRLVFDDAHHPDFILDLWPPEHAHAAARPHPASAGAAITEANRWVARCEAVMRRAAPVRTAVSAAPPPIADPAPEPARPLAPRAAPAAEPPPWEDADDEDEDFDIPGD